MDVQCESWKMKAFFENSMSQFSPHFLSAFTCPASILRLILCKQTATWGQSLSGEAKHGLVWLEYSICVVQVTSAQENNREKNVWSLHQLLQVAATVKGFIHGFVFISVSGYVASCSPEPFTLRGSLVV